MQDKAILEAQTIINNSLREYELTPIVKAFFDEDSFTFTYVVTDPLTKESAIIDSVLNYDLFSGRTSRYSLDAIIDYVNSNGLSVKFIMETHIHADHLSGASILREEIGGRIAVGEEVKTVNRYFSGLFKHTTSIRLENDFFDVYFSDGEKFNIGSIEGIVLSVPGHTPACVAYVIGDSVFVGDTMFMPDYGTARCDFPGGNSSQLYTSIRRLMLLPDQTKILVCHDYKSENRDSYAWETSIAEQKMNNIHINEGVDEIGFVKVRNARD